MREFEEGDIVEVVGNVSGQNLIGQTFEISGKTMSQYGFAGTYKVREGNWAFWPVDLKLIKVSSKRLDERMKKLKVKMEEIQMMKEFCGEKKEFDAKEFKNYQLKKIIGDTSISVEERVNKIQTVMATSTQ